MNWEEVQKDWGFVRQRVMLTWGKLSEDDLTLIRGDRGRFIERYASRYGIRDDIARVRVEEFAEGLELPSQSPANSPKHPR